MKAGGELTFLVSDIFPEIVGKILAGKIFYINAHGKRGKLIANRWNDGGAGYSITHIFTEEEAREVNGQKCRIKARIVFEGNEFIPGPVTLTTKEIKKEL